MGKPIAKLNPAHKGMLHRDLGIAAKHHIPMSKLVEAEHSRDPAIRKRAIFAINSKGWKH